MIKLNNQVKKRIKLNKFYNDEFFISDCKSYISAVKSGRLRYVVMRVSSSGMRRNIDVYSYEGNMLKGYYRNYRVMLESLGYSLDKHGFLKISGVGMDMAFHTNYTIIHEMRSMGLMSQKLCERLAQKI